MITYRRGKVRFVLLGAVLVVCGLVTACGTSMDDDGTDELCNGVDDDHDGQIDEDPVDGTTYNIDAGGDGWGAATRLCQPPTAPVVARSGDCRDDLPTAFPGS